jgi:hypothetical protein
MTAAQLREGRYPAGSCQQLLVFSDEMPAILGDIIGGAKAATFANELKSVHKIEQLHGELKSLAESEVCTKARFSRHLVRRPTRTRVVRTSRNSL